MCDALLQDEDRFHHYYQHSAISNTVCALFFCVQTQKINTGVTMLNWLQMKVIFSHSPPLCLGNSVQRQSQAEMGTLNSPLGCYFGNPCIHIYCQYEGMHRNKDFIRTQYTHQH